MVRRLARLLATWAILYAYLRTPVSHASVRFWGQNLSLSPLKQESTPVSGQRRVQTRKAGMKSMKPTSIFA